MIKDNRTIPEILQAEIDRCHILVAKRFASTRTHSKVMGAVINRDILRAEKAIKDNDATGMFHALRALRLNN